MKSLLSLAVLLTVAGKGLCGMCRLPPFEEEICETPLVFKGKVENVEESMEGSDWRTLTNTYTIKVQEIYRAAGGLNLKAEDLVKLVAPNQLISTAVYMEKGEEYFIRGTLTEENGQKKVNSGFCENRPFTYLTVEEKDELNNISCSDE